MKMYQIPSLPTQFRSSVARTTLAFIFILVTLLGFLSAANGQLPTLVLSNKWSLAAGSRWDLDTANQTRGIAINKATGNILLASRVTTNHISILSGVDGGDLGTLESSVISGTATLPLVLVRVADD